MQLVLFSIKPRWIVPALVIAGGYFLAVGVRAVFFSYSPFHTARCFGNDMPALDVMGFAAMVLGVAYLRASLNPFKYWRAIFLGITGKGIFIAGVIFLFFKTKNLIISPTFLLGIAVWIIPFFVILFKAYKYHCAIDEQLNYFNKVRVNTGWENYKIPQGQSLSDISYNQQVLLIFLRHFGCSFCKETLIRIKKDRAHLEHIGVRIVLIHMEKEEEVLKIINEYSLHDIARISDPECRLYEDFGLEKGGFRQLYGPKVLIRMAKNFLKYRSLIRVFAVNNAQLPGAFLLHKGSVIRGYKHFTIADTPSYIRLSGAVGKTASGSG